MTFIQTCALVIVDYSCILPYLSTTIKCQHFALQVFGEYLFTHIVGPRQANLVLIAYASSEGSGEPAHPRSLARTSAARSYKQ